MRDVLEDTSVTVDELRNMFSNEIVDGVITLTHRKDESYFEYISMSIYIKVSEKSKDCRSLYHKNQRTNKNGL